MYLFLFSLLSLFLNTNTAFGWGAVGHMISVRQAATLVPSATWNLCHLTEDQLVRHVNDPDNAWRQQSVFHPNEAFAHFFHIDRQPKNWKTLNKPEQLDDGFLVYRIVSWFDEAKTLRKGSSYEPLYEKIYGLAHYLGDLTQPMHLHHDHDGVDAGVPGAHSQFETKMINRFKNEVEAAVAQKVRREGIPALWKKVGFRNLVFNTAVQSHDRLARLYVSIKPALEDRNHSRGKNRNQKQGFIKKTLWENTGELASDQLAISSRLIALMLNEICQ